MRKSSDSSALDGDSVSSNFGSGCSTESWLESKVCSSVKTGFSTVGSVVRSWSLFLNGSFCFVSRGVESSMDLLTLRSGASKGSTVFGFPDSGSTLDSLRKERIHLEGKRGNKKSGKEKRKSMLYFKGPKIASKR